MHHHELSILYDLEECVLRKDDNYSEQRSSKNQITHRLSLSTSKQATSRDNLDIAHHCLYSGKKNYLSIAILISQCGRRHGIFDEKRMGYNSSHRRTAARNEIWSEQLEETEGSSKVARWCNDT